MVVADVDCAEVPIFVDEEVDCIDCVENCCDYDGFCNETVDLVLVGHEREITGDASVSLRKDESCDRVKRQRIGTHTSVQRSIPSLPLQKSLKSKCSPNLGLNSMPIYRSYRTEPMLLA